VNEKWGGMGWERDLPDLRDYTSEARAVKEVLVKSRPLKAAEEQLPPSVDLRKWCSPIEDQGSLGSCTANAGVALMEYYQRRAFGKYLDGSIVVDPHRKRRFLLTSGGFGPRGPCGDPTPRRGGSVRCASRLACSVLRVGALN